MVTTAVVTTVGGAPAGAKGEFVRKVMMFVVTILLTPANGLGLVICKLGKRANNAAGGLVKAAAARLARLLVTRNVGTWLLTT